MTMMSYIRAKLRKVTKIGALGHDNDVIYKY